MRLFPRNDRYFELFDEAATNVVAASSRLVEVVSREDIGGEHVRQLVEEQEQQEWRGTVPEVIAELEHAFVTPFDREDMLALAYELDDVIGETLDILHLLDLHKAESPPGALRELCDILAKASEQLASALPALRDLKSISFARFSLDMGTLLRRGRHVQRHAIAELLSSDGDRPSRQMLEWERILDQFPNVFDHLQQASRILETTVVKYS